MESAHLGEEKKKKKKRHHLDAEKGRKKKRRLFMLQSFEFAIMVRGFVLLKVYFCS